MVRARAALVVAVMLAALPGAAPGGSDAEPGGYAVRLPITPAPGGGAQRVTLPPAVLVALKRPDGGDLRVFDGRGRPVPIARWLAGAAPRRDELAVSPLLGPAEGPAGARVSVRLDAEGRARVAEVEGAGGNAEAESATVRGALVDARAITGTAERLELGLDLPPGQPVRLTVEASRDLDGWRPLGERVLYRAPGTGAGADAIPLGGAALDREWLRVGWRAEGRALSPVAVRRAVLVSRGEAEGEVVADARAPMAGDAHDFEFALPFATPVASLLIRSAPGDAPTPVRVLGRDEEERPWLPLGEGMAGPDAAAIRLEGAVTRMIRIEADRRTPGFSAAPTLRFGFARQELAFVAAGPPPFTLAAGRAGAADIFLPAEAVTGGRAALPEAAVAPAPARLALAAPDRGEGTRRRVLLWSVLLGAVALLGGMAWLLWRRTPAS